MEPLQVNARWTIPAVELSVTFARSGGPGGQNVNKVASKAVLRFDLERSQSAGDARRARLRSRLASKLTQAGELVLHASSHREQERNLQDARERLAGLLREALRVERPRKATKPTRASQRRRVDAKKRRGERKRDRRNLD
ncbi:MAG: alternative ribosome rescue aminoacyl-tRNA hydrolase ArfB [Planctomycetota bacterium]|nr:alternative ribosome rescue aminoacyl-tRNA hydrolase ArfB [Planctomycetota bacterium]